MSRSIRSAFLISVVAVLVAVPALAQSVAPNLVPQAPDPTDTTDPVLPSTGVSRPIQDFLDAQGTYCIDDGMGGCLLFVPPVANFLGWSDPATGLLASVDYAGLADEYLAGALGTSHSGSVRERALPDGRAEVRVFLQTTNALSWATAGDFNAPLWFGSRVTDVLSDGALPSLGASFLWLHFINTSAGAPLPDLLQLVFAPEPGQELLRVAFQAGADGLLRSPSGFPDGTPGRLVVVEQGLFMTGFHGAVGDGFPVERIDLLPTGQ